MDISLHLDFLMDAPERSMIDDRYTAGFWRCVMVFWSVTLRLVPPPSHSAVARHLGEWKKMPIHTVCIIDDQE